MFNRGRRYAGSLKCGHCQGTALKRDFLIRRLASQLVKGVIALISWLSSLRGLCRFCTVPVLGRPKQSQQRDDYFRHVALLTFTVLVTAQLEPAFDKKEFTASNKLPSYLRPAAPGNAANPESIGLLLPVAVLVDLDSDGSVF